MNIKQAQELFTLITTVRHVEEMCETQSPVSALVEPTKPACILAEGMRHGLYTFDQVKDENGQQYKFYRLFGCKEDEQLSVMFAKNSMGFQSGEIVYQAGKELLLKYGYADFFEEENKPEALSFSEIMESLRGEVA